MKKHMFRLGLLGLLVLWGLHSTAQKSQVRTGDHVRITEKADGNTYVAGGEITVDAEITGDLIGAGGNIRIAQKIQNDILLAGGDLSIDGETGGDLRLMGGNIRINKPVAGDLTITGGEIRIPKDVRIGGDVYIAGGNVWIEGDIAGNLRIAGGEVFLSGTVMGNLHAQTGHLGLSGTVKGTSKIVAQEIDLGSDARFEGDVQYWTKRENGADFSKAMAGGAQAKYDNALRPGYDKVDWKHSAKKGMAAFTAFRAVSGLLLTLLLVAFFNTFFAGRAGLARQFAARSMTRGLLLFLGLPFLSFIATITVIGIPVGLIGFSAFTAIALSANAVTAVVAAHELTFAKNWKNGSGQIALLAGGLFLGLRVVGLVPFIGPLANFVLAAIAIGHVARHFDKQANPAPATPQKEEPDSDLV
ncbi:MAG: polymer-forming cytoskeletal protein [Haliscomenobacter sp.]|nr:polymer-forming cytoskeletal protein [Haliscomenobacter sp.]